MSGGLFGRVETTDGLARLGKGGARVGEIVGRLEAGEALGGLGLEPADLVAALAFEALGEGDGPPLVQASPRRPRLEVALSERSLAELFPDTPRPSRLAMAAGLLQAHDFWDASHAAAQEADDLGERSVSAYWHGIGHRREPDPGNAAYWFRRVGRHPVYPALAEAARGLLEGAPSLLARLVPGGVWDPLAFVHVCTSARGGEAELARRVQRSEMVLLLEATFGGASGTRPSR